MNKQLITSRTGFYALFAALLFLVLCLTVIFATAELGGGVSAQGPLTIEVRRGESVRNLAYRLSREGVVESPGLLRFLAVLRGDSARIKAGEYVLQGNESLNRLLDFLVAGRAKFISLTVPEGFAMAEIARRVEAKGLAGAEEFLRLARDPRFIASFGLPLRPEFPTLEGYIYPETYYFNRGVGAAKLLSQMVGEFQRRALGFLQKSAANVGLSPYDALILASIIEKETGRQTERRTISAVFHNRLKAGMRLGSDPTVIYGIPDFDGNLTRAHLRQETRYNTYKIIGLPPTPIANPGLESLRAAVNPARVGYLYFVSKGDGSHFFSSDLKTHNRAVWKFQKRPHRKRRS